MKQVLLALAVLAALIGSASPAHADQYDFISKLDANGVAYTGYMSDMIDLGKTVCHELRAGTPVPNIVGFLSSRNFPEYDAGTIVGAAATTMCPDTWPSINSYLHPPAVSEPSPCSLPNPPAGCADGSY